MILNFLERDGKIPFYFFLDSFIYYAYKHNLYDVKNQLDTLPENSLHYWQSFSVANEAFDAEKLYQHFKDDLIINLNYKGSFEKTTQQGEMTNFGYWQENYLSKNLIQDLKENL
jgi:hypothetical protein